MNNPLRTAEDYELFLYTLAEQYPSIERSTVSFQRRGRTLARVSGEIFFVQGFRLVVSERIVYDRLPAVLDWYGYEIWQHQEKLYGMIHSHIQTIPTCRAPIRTTSICHQTSSTTVFRPQA